MESSPLHGLVFSTASDAFLAHLLVEKDFAISQLSKALQIFRNGEFHRSSLSLCNIADVYAERSHERRSTRLSLQRHASPMVKARAVKSSGIPNLVLDLVVQHFSATRRPFHGLAARFSLPQPQLCECESALLNMSMVHRSWTSLSQRTLARRIQIRGVEGIQRALALPSIGLWTREVLFTCATRLDYDGDFDGELPSEVIPYLNALVRKLQNIQLLSVWTYFDEYNFDVSLMRSFLDALKGLERLKGLWLSHRNFNGAIINGINPCLAELCLVLPEYRSLQALHLEGWSTPTQGPRRLLRSTQTYLHIPKWKLRSYASPPPPPLQITPAKCLRRLSLKWYPRKELPVCYVDWLLRRRGEYGITSFCLELQMDSEEDGEMADAFEPLSLITNTSSCEPRRFVAVISNHLSEIATVQLVLWEDPWTSLNEPHGPGSLLIPLVEKCSSACELHITLHSNAVNETGVDLDSRIAPTVEALYVQVDAPYGYENGFLVDVDATLLRLLEKNNLPKLKTFVLVAWMSADDVDTEIYEQGSPVFLPASSDATSEGRFRLRSADFCASKGVRFVHVRDNMSLVMRT